MKALKFFVLYKYFGPYYTKKNQKNIKINTIIDSYNFLIFTNMPL